MQKENSRRRFIKSAGGALLLAPVVSSIVGCSSTKSSAQNHLKQNSNAGTSNLILDVRDFGAKGNGTVKDTLSIQQAIDRCWVLGGGEVLMPAGNYLTGAIALKSNVIICLEKDAVITGTADFADYPVAQVRWEGKWMKGHVGLIYAFDAKNIGIIGAGKIVGNPALGGRPNAQYPLRHPALIEMIGCDNIRLEDFSTSYRLMWSIHPTYCNNIFIKNLTIRSTGGNGDGIDIDSCKHVRIDNCDIDTGDDCIAIKSGRGMEGYTLLRTTEDVHITNCTFADTIFACIGIGSETSGGIRNVLVENCKFTKAKTFAVYIKSRPGRGAFIEDIVCRNLDVSGTEGGFLRFNILGSGLQDENPVPGDEGIPTIKNFSFSDVRVNGVPVLVDGSAIHPNKPLQGFTLTNVSGTCKKGIVLANIKNAKLKDVKVTGYEGPLLSIYNVEGRGFDGSAKLDAPKVPEPINSPVKKFKLH
ncbi:MAG TPA: glycoside hydrolase family 28 protein [Flavisolibacter sp.]|nr:glycoside hydrolase family 28 protein [Flavisolibacter sp.]